MTVVPKPGGYTSVDRRGEQHVHSLGTRQLGVARLVARVGVQVLAAARTGSG